MELLFSSNWLLGINVSISASWERGDTLYIPPNRTLPSQAYPWLSPLSLSMYIIIKEPFIFTVAGYSNKKKNLVAWLFFNDWHMLTSRWNKELVQSTDHILALYQIPGVCHNCLMGFIERLQHFWCCQLEMFVIYGSERLIVDWR